MVKPGPKGIMKQLFISIFPAAVICCSALGQELKPGDVIWEFETGDMVQSSPAIGSDGTIYVGSDDYSLYAIKEINREIPSATDSRNSAEILLEQHIAKHGEFGIRTWSVDGENLKSFDETKGQYEILSPAEFAERFGLGYPIKQFYRARMVE